MDAPNEATDPSIAKVAADEAVVSEGAAKTAASNAIKEAEIARAAAVVAVAAKDQVFPR